MNKMNQGLKKTDVNKVIILLINWNAELTFGLQIYWMNKNWLNILSSAS